MTASDASEHNPIDTLTDTTAALSDSFTDLNEQVTALTRSMSRAADGFESFTHDTAAVLDDQSTQTRTATGSQATRSSADN